MSEASVGKKTVVKKSGVPALVFGGVWLAWSLLFPLHRIGQYIACGVISAAALLIAKKACPDKTVEVEVREPEINTGNADADELVRSGRALLAEIASAASGIKNAQVRAKLSTLDGISRDILKHVEREPRAAGNLRKFLNYYLPTLKKLTETYALMEQQGVAGENISTTMTRIDGMLDLMTDAFRRQLDALFAFTTLDVTSDIAAMQSLMAQEGLTVDRTAGLGGTQG